MGVTGNANENLPLNTLQREHPECPYNGLLRFDDWEGTFVSPVHNKRHPDKAPCFLVRLRRLGTDILGIVKLDYNYSGTYGNATREFLHALELAPPLYSAVDLHRGLMMVV